MSDLNLFHGPNAGYVVELYDRYLQDPQSVDETTRAFFDAYPLREPAPPVQTPAPPFVAPQRTSGPAPLDVALATARLARFIRQRGHLGAHINPLESAPPQPVDLRLKTHKLSAEVLDLLPSRIIGGPIAEETFTALEAINRLREVYSGTIGYEDEHIQDAEERYWLRDSAESRRFFKAIDADKKRDLLHRLTEVDLFEDFIHKTFQNEKRFSIEGCDALVPILDEIIRHAAVSGTREAVVGMAHRGRLNVLAHVLGKPYSMIFQEFSKGKGKGEASSVTEGGSEGWLGDVKYHLGYLRAFKEAEAPEMPLMLVPNPSHLEFVNPVVEGHARAAQERYDRPGAPLQDLKASLPIVIHGDAAFPGQGIVAETLNLSRLPGYNTGGTIHIIVNNQIGFTTLPGDSRSTLYASDLAKGFEIPIVHVNADDPVACIAAARMACAYRAKFGKDFLIDLIGYRRYGHNEGDQPRTTQPRMYALIEVHPRPREVWAQELEREGLVTPAEVETMIAKTKERLRAALANVTTEASGSEPEEKRPAPHRVAVETGVSAELLTVVNEEMLRRPEGFTPDPTSERRFYAARREALTQPGGIFWAHAEALAFASILTDGVPIRMSGQDSERGTFDQRRLVLHDILTGERYVPMQHLSQARASFAVYNSPLSENAVLGFEYGYSIHAPGALVLWEAQYGDFANGAQVIIDQFLTSGNAKWRQTPSLVLLLPHGYEGGGPEHSSARLERFLQMTASDNIRIVNCTTPAQYFHLLRRQAASLAADPRPLVVMTPKSLLRDRNAAASLEELTQGKFQAVIDDMQARQRADQVTRLVLCSGKVYMDLAYSGQGKVREAFEQATQVAAARVEELYPFPEEALRTLIAGYPKLQEIVWLQEEPRNMGAWSYMEPRLRALIEAAEWPLSLRYIGRTDAASTAEGSHSWHTIGQERIVQAVLASRIEGTEPPLRELITT